MSSLTERFPPGTRVVCTEEDIHGGGVAERGVVVAYSAGSNPTVARVQLDSGDHWWDGFNLYWESELEYEPTPGPEPVVEEIDLAYSRVAVTGYESGSQIRVVMEAQLHAIASYVDLSTSLTLADGTTTFVPMIDERGGMVLHAEWHPSKERDE